MNWDFLKESLLSIELTTFSVIIKLIISFVLGAVVGMERQTRRSSAGMRTFALISMGSTAAMLLSVWIPQAHPEVFSGDPGRIAAQILTGIGFIGAGAIIQSKGSVHGLTTAASIWVAAIAGMSVGAGTPILGVGLVVISVLALIALGRLDIQQALNGEMKLLTVYYDTDSPSIEKIKEILKTHSIYMYNISVEKDFREQTSIIRVRIQVDPRSTLGVLYDDVKKQVEFVSKISLESV